MAKTVKLHFWNDSLCESNHMGEFSYGAISFDLHVDKDISINELKRKITDKWNVRKYQLCINYCPEFKEELNALPDYWIIGEIYFYNGNVIIENLHGDTLDYNYDPQDGDVFKFEMTYFKNLFRNYPVLNK